MKIDRTVPYIDFFMRRPPLDPPKQTELPEGYGYAFYKSGDMRAWAEIEVSVDEFDSIADAEGYFSREFLPYEAELTRRMLFAVSPDGRKVATSTAWFSEKGAPMLHWVAVMPEYQSKGVGRAIISKATTLLCELNPNSELWLHTQVNSHRAVSIYRDMGYEMCPATDMVSPTATPAEQLVYAKAILYAKNAINKEQEMEYEVITTDSVDFGKANIAAIANYRWYDDYTPAARARLIYVEGKGIAARLECDEDNPKATYKNFYEDVYKDSCLEFFFGFVKGGGYLNCEMNSIGTCLIQYGEERSDRTRIDKIITPPTIKAGRDGKTWYVEVMFTLDEIKKIFGEVKIGRGTTFYGNFYKCGDETEHEHYGMWSPVMTEQPDFHRPEYFGSLTIV